ncbi:MAG: hypothetical protein H6603_00730 [Flavobacteriales bacterium]|nr:hypothetical protein [Flavobacteriales bacterium]MCB9203472.1 hypothetical protein [Flavobacteriales bacterium]
MKRLSFFLFSILLFFGCSKDPELVPDNNAPYYSEVSDLLIENYVNRVYIDQIGREPFDTEMNSEVQTLKAADLSFEARDAMILKLQTSTDFIPGDGSYKQAYYNRLYEQGKARFLEAASNAEIGQVMGPIASGIINDSLNGNWEGLYVRYELLEKLQAVLDSEEKYMNGEMEIKDVCAAMVNNAVYDEINMNTFNFVNASFDNLFFRFPTEQEFYAGFNMIEYNQPANILGVPGQNKDDYVDILVNSREFYEGLIVWSYQTLLAREPSTAETNALMIDLYTDHDLQKVQRAIMITDEYAHFD